MEKLDLKVKASRAKCLGTLVSVAGALLITIYKGPGIEFVSIDSSMLGHNHNHLWLRSNWIIGGFLTAAAAFMVAVLLVFQVDTTIISFPHKMLKDYRGVYQYVYELVCSV